MPMTAAAGAGIRRVAWALILLTPLLTLLNNYLAQYVLYRTVTPAQ